MFILRNPFTLLSLPRILGVPLTAGQTKAGSSLKIHLWQAQDL
jgi:hypothetical protein